MKAEYPSEGGNPLCPDCNELLDNVDANGRDNETMGGYSIEYYQCCSCREHYELIKSPFDGDKLHYCSP